MFFLPQLYDEKEDSFKLHQKLKKLFEEWKIKVDNIKGYLYYNALEKFILGLELNAEEK